LIDIFVKVSTLDLNRGLWPASGYLLMMMMVVMMMMNSRWCGRPCCCYKHSACCNGRRSLADILLSSLHRVRSTLCFSVSPSCCIRYLLHAVWNFFTLC